MPVGHPLEAIATLCTLEPYTQCVAWAGSPHIWHVTTLDHGTTLESLARGQRQGEMRTSLSLRRHGQHTGARWLGMLDLEETPKDLFTQLPLRGKRLKPACPHLTSPRTLVTDLSLHAGISKPAPRSPSPHTYKEVTTLNNARVGSTHPQPCSSAG